MNFEELKKEAVREIGNALENIDETHREAFFCALEKAERVFCAGAGRSKLIISAFAMRLMHMGFKTHVVGDMTTPGIKKEDILLLVSGSGETGSLVAMAHKAIKLGAKVLLVTSNEHSTLSELSSEMVYIPSSNKLYEGKPSIQPGANLFEQSALIYLDLLIADYMNRKGINNQNLMQNHANLE